MCKSDPTAFFLKLASTSGKVPNVLVGYSRPFQALEDSSRTKWTVTEQTMEKVRSMVIWLWLISLASALTTLGYKHLGLLRGPQGTIISSPGLNTGWSSAWNALPASRPLFTWLSNSYSHPLGQGELLLLRICTVLTQCIPLRKIHHSILSFSTPLSAFPSTRQVLLEFETLSDSSLSSLYLEHWASENIQ